MRVSRLEPNGVPDPGPNNLYVSDALARFRFTPNKREGSEIEVPNACGGLCGSYKGCDITKWYDIELDLCTPDPQLTEMLASGAVLTDGAAVGYQFPPLNDDSCPTAVSIEIWAKRITRGGGLDPDFPYAWWVWPWVELTIDESTFEDGPFTPTFAGKAIENENWFDGPENDWPVASDAVAQWIPTATLPTASCGYRTLVAS